MDSDVGTLLLALMNGSQVAVLAWITRRTQLVKRELHAVLEWLPTHHGAPTQEQEEPRP